MNKRIKELIAQCTHQVYDSRTRLTDKFDKEKFAELLVKACAEVVRNDLKSFGADERMKHLKKHFGVKE